MRDNEDDEVERIYEEQEKVEELLPKKEEFTED
jgi:hypothetical protein